MAAKSKKKVTATTRNPLEDPVESAKNCIAVAELNAVSMSDEELVKLAIAYALVAIAERLSPAEREVGWGIR